MGWQWEYVGIGGKKLEGSFEKLEVLGRLGKNREGCVKKLEGCGKKWEGCGKNWEGCGRSGRSRKSVGRIEKIVEELGNFL